MLKKALAKAKPIVIFMSNIPPNLIIIQLTYKKPIVIRLMTFP